MAGFPTKKRKRKRGFSLGHELWPEKREVDLPVEKERFRGTHSKKEKMLRDRTKRTYTS